jgi:hypothetical protein
MDVAGACGSGRIRMRSAGGRRRYICRRREREEMRAERTKRYSANNPQHFIYELHVLHVELAPDTRVIGRWSVVDGRCLRSTEKGDKCK